MRRVFWWLTIVFLVLVLLFVTLGCGETKKAVIGEWKGVGSNNTIKWIKFNENGYVNFDDLGRDVCGTYEFIDDNTIKFDTPLSDTDVFLDVTISGDRLILFPKDAPESKLEFIRVK